MLLTTRRPSPATSRPLATAPHPLVPLRSSQVRQLVRLINKIQKCVTLKVPSLAATAPAPSLRKCSGRLQWLCPCGGLNTTTRNALTAPPRSLVLLCSTHTRQLVNSRQGHKSAAVPSPPLLWKNKKQKKTNLLRQWKITPHTSRVGQNHIYTPLMTVYLVISLPKILYKHRI